MKILVVEDEPTLNKIIAKRLKIEAYSVDCAFNGKEALEYLDAAEYDLLIVDIMMPEMDGLTLVKKIREKGSRVPAPAEQCPADSPDPADPGGSHPGYPDPSGDPGRPGDFSDSQGVLCAGLSPAEPGDGPVPGTDPGTRLGFFL